MDTTLIRLLYRRSLDQLLAQAGEDGACDLIDAVRRGEEEFLRLLAAEASVYPDGMCIPGDPVLDVFGCRENGTLRYLDARYPGEEYRRYRFGSAFKRTRGVKAPNTAMAAMSLLLDEEHRNRVRTPEFIAAALEGPLYGDLPDFHRFAAINPHLAILESEPVHNKASIACALQMIERGLPALVHQNGGYMLRAYQVNWYE